jgi:hypothetical protein
VCDGGREGGREGRRGGEREIVGRRRENQLAHRRIPSKQPHLVVDIVGGPVRARSLLQKLPELHGRRAPAIEPRLQRRTPPLSKIRRRPQLSAAVHAREGQMDLDNAHRAERGWGAGDRHGRERHGLQPGVTHTVVCRRYVPSQTSDVFPTGRRTRRSQDSRLRPSTPFGAPPYPKLPHVQLQFSEMCRGEKSILGRKIAFPKVPPRQNGSTARSNKDEADTTQSDACKTAVLIRQFKLCVHTVQLEGLDVLCCILRA